MNAMKVDKILKLLKGRLDESEYEEVASMLEPEVDVDPGYDASAAERRPYGSNPVREDWQRANDAALAPYGSHVVRSMNEYNEAVRRCAPVLGSAPLACDSAEAVYGAALRRLGHDVSRISPSSYRFVFDAATRQGGMKPAPRLSRADMRSPALAHASRIQQL